MILIGVCGQNNKIFSLVFSSNEFNKKYLILDFGKTEARNSVKHISVFICIFIDNSKVIVYCKNKYHKEN